MRLFWGICAWVALGVGSALAANPIVTENQLPGTPQSQWDIANTGSTTLQGFATDISVNHGSTINFKIQSATSNWRIDIYRLGYYQGNGARLITTIAKSGAVSQPTPLRDSTTGLVDAGNWTVTASWAVPSTAVSGVYIAHLVDNTNSGNENHIPFVVRADEFDKRHHLPDIRHHLASLQWLAMRHFRAKRQFLRRIGPRGRVAREWRIYRVRPRLQGQLQSADCDPRQLRHFFRAPGFSLRRGIRCDILVGAKRLQRLVYRGS